MSFNRFIGCQTVLFHTVAVFVCTCSTFVAVALFSVVVFCVAAVSFPCVYVGTLVVPCSLGHPLQAQLSFATRLVPCNPSSTQ